MSSKNLAEQYHAPCEAPAVVKRADGFDVIRCIRDRHGRGQGVHLAPLNGRYHCWLPEDMDDG